MNFISTDGQMSSEPAKGSNEAPAGLAIFYTDNDSKGGS